MYNNKNQAKYFLLLIRSYIVCPYLLHHSKPNISQCLRNTFIKLECKTRYLISSFIIFIRIIVIQNWCYTYKKYNTSIFISTKHVVSCLCIMIDMVGLHKWCANRSFGTHCGHRVLKKTPGLEVLCFKKFNFVFISIIICESFIVRSWYNRIFFTDISYKII